MVFAICLCLVFSVDRYLNHRLVKAEESVRKATEELKADADKYMDELRRQKKVVADARSLAESKMEELRQMIESMDA